MGNSAPVSLVFPWTRESFAKEQHPFFLPKMSLGGLGGISGAHMKIARMLF